MLEAKPRDTNMQSVLSLLDNDKSTLLVPEAKPRDTNNYLASNIEIIEIEIITKVLSSA